MAAAGMGLLIGSVMPADHAAELSGASRSHQQESPKAAESAAPAPPAASPPDATNIEAGIPPTLHPSLRNHRADLESLAAQGLDKDTALTRCRETIGYLCDEDPEAAIRYALSPAFRKSDAGLEPVASRLVIADPSRLITLGRESGRPGITLQGIAALAERDPEAAQREIESEIASDDRRAPVEEKIRNLLIVRKAVRTMADQ